jgi:hypothetical protein
MTTDDPTRPRSGSCDVPGARTRRRARRLVRLSTLAGVPLAAALTAGPAVATAVVVLGTLVWGLWRWPRWEARLFEPARAVEPRSRVWAPPLAAPFCECDRRADGHRAFAQALHAVTGAYLAECEREAGR